MLPARTESERPLPAWAHAVLPGLAGWLGWGIRGQVGHETGAMVPGAMIGLSLALLSEDPELRRRAGLLGAVGAMGISFGGTETYAQTLGLSHGPGREQTYWWGMLGTALKGALWFGLGGTHLGMAAGEVSYSPLALLALTGVEAGVWHLGVELLNRPHQPPDRLPAIYFSCRTGKYGDRPSPPRPEIWGGQLCALIALLGFAALKGDRTALKVGAAGIAGGALGFAGGQAIHAWARNANLPEPVNRTVDYWKIMETTFGMVAGAALGLGLRAASRGRELAPRRRFPAWQNAIAALAGAWGLGAHLADQEWTDLAMDDMIIGGAAIAGAHASDALAWMQTLPLTYAYTSKNTVEYFRDEAGLPDAAAGVNRASGPITAAMGALGAVLDEMEGTQGAPAAIALQAIGWSQTLLTDVKMLTDTHTLGRDDEAPKALAPVEVVRQVVARSASDKCPRSSRSQLVTQSAFMVAALGLSALAWWALGRRGAQD